MFVSKLKKNTFIIWNKVTNLYLFVLSNFKSNKTVANCNSTSKNITTICGHVEQYLVVTRLFIIATLIEQYRIKKMLLNDLYQPV